MFFIQKQTLAHLTDNLVLNKQVFTLSSGNANARQEGDLTPEEWADFQKRHGDWIDAQYQGGFAQFQADLRGR